MENQCKLIWAMHISVSWTCTGISQRFTCLVCSKHICSRQELNSQEVLWFGLFSFCSRRGRLIVARENTQPFGATQILTENFVTSSKMYYTKHIHKSRTTQSIFQKVSNTCSMAVQENIGAGSIYAVKIKATFDNTHISLCGRTGCGYTCIYCLGNGRINFALQYNLQNRTKNYSS